MHRGYPADDRLRCLGESLAITLTSANLCREVDSDLPCLSRLKLSRYVRRLAGFVRVA